MRIAVFMLVGYVLTNNILALSFETDAMRSNDGLKYLFLFQTAPIASVTPIIYGVLYHYLLTRNGKTAYNSAQSRQAEGGSFS
jgi:hypothetical protein